MIHYFLILLFLVSCAPLGNRSIILPPGQDYMTIKSGKVHRSCLLKFGEKLPKLITESTLESQACLLNLKKAKSDEFAAKLQKIYNQKSITYVCNQDDLGNSVARASLDKSDFDLKKGLVYPYISFNPKYVLSDSDMKGKNISDYNLKSTLFHETLHFLGYRHWSTPEYVYACDECCFPYANGDQKKACKICTTNYKNIADERYMKDFWEWAGYSEMADYIGRHKVVRQALIIKPASDFHLKIFLENSTENSMTAHFFSLRIPQKNYTKVTSGRKFTSESKTFEPIAKSVADIQYDLYFKGDVNSAYKKIMKLDTSVLADGLKFTGKTYDYAYSVWDWILYDIGVVADYYHQKKNFELSGEVWARYDKIYAYVN